MNAKKKITALILTLILILSSLTAVSCGDKADPAASDVTTEPAVNPGNDTDPINTDPVFEKKDYKGETVKVLMRAMSTGTYMPKYMMPADLENGDYMDNETFTRNSMVESQYNIKLAFEELESGFNDRVKKDAEIGAGDYQILLNLRNSMSKLITDGYLYDFNKLDIDYSAPWWDQNCKNDLAIKGKNFLMQNDISTWRFSGARFFYFNKQIIENYKLADPYALYDADNWDLDHFLAMVSGVKTESEGTQTLGTYGLIVETGSTNGIHMHLCSGIGIKFAEVGSDGKWTSTVPDNIEKIDNAFEKIRTVFKDKTCAMTFSEAKAKDVLGEGSGENDFSYGRSLFAKGHFLFTHSNISVSSGFVDMKDEYGVAPNPKYNSDQKQYVHKDDAYSLIFAIPKTDDIDYEMVGRVFDFWAYASSKTVSPAFYEVTIKTKRAYEPKAGEMIDLVKATVRTELEELITGSNINSLLDTAYSGTSVSSLVKSAKKLIDNWAKTINEMKLD